MHFIHHLINNNYVLPPASITLREGVKALGTISGKPSIYLSYIFLTYISIACVFMDVVND